LGLIRERDRGNLEHVPFAPAVTEQGELCGQWRLSPP
jgi:hypothetical protein